MMTRDSTRLAPFTTSIWTASTPVRFAGTWFPHVMAAVRLADGTLLLHSPCKPSEELLNDIAGLGDVSHVVAPNWFHDLYLSEYRKLYADATFWGPEFLRRRSKGVVDQALDGATRPPWFDQMPYVALRGLLTFDECVFFHVRSRTLIVADLLMNVFVTNETPPLTRLVARLFHLDGTLRIFPLVKWLFPSERSILRAGIRQMLDWNPAGLVVGHGRPVTGNISADLRAAFAWLKPD
jgi:hypothetical protein